LGREERAFFFFKNLAILSRPVPFHPSDHGDRAWTERGSMQSLGKKTNPQETVFVLNYLKNVDGTVVSIEMTTSVIWEAAFCSRSLTWWRIWKCVYGPFRANKVPFKLSRKWKRPSFFRLQIREGDGREIFKNGNDSSLSLQIA